MQMEKIVKFSKPSGVMFEHKKSFFEENDTSLKAEQDLAKLYLEQPQRTHCKNCNDALGEVVFVKMDIPYAICTKCTHVNGLHEDTDEFCQKVYVDDGGDAYGVTYGSADKAAYSKRVADIYTPKAKFLKEVLQANGHNPEVLRYADLGAGAGYFAAGMLEAGLKNVTSYEVSPMLVKLSQAMRPDVDMMLVGLEDEVSLAQTIDADVVSLIGVLEHVRHPREVLAALRDNPHVKYIFMLVPMFSPSVFLELAFPNVAPRLLGVEHTHLYTEKSIEYFAKEFGMRSVGEWWFGADMMDLYRCLMVTVTDNPTNKAVGPTLAHMMVPMIDSLQGAVDHSKLCSEVHMVLKFDGK